MSELLKESYILYVELYLKEMGPSSATNICGALYEEFEELTGKTSRELTQITTNVIYSLVWKGLIRFDSGLHGWIWI